MMWRIKIQAFGFNRVGSVEEVFIQKCEGYEISFSDEEFALPEDIYQLDCSDKDKALITSLFFFFPETV